MQAHYIGKGYAGALAKAVARATGGNLVRPRAGLTDLATLSDIISGDLNGSTLGMRLNYPKGVSPTVMDAYIYVLTPAGIAEKAGMTQRFLARKLQEFHALEAEIESLRAETQKPTADLSL